MGYTSLLIRLFTVIFIFFVSSCNQSPLGAGYKLRDDEYLVDIVERQAARQLQKELSLQLVGTGAQMMDEIRMLSLNFEYDKPIEAYEGRKLLVRAVDVFLATINANEEIRPYLIQYPFKPENIEIRIFLRSADRSDVPPGKLSVVTALEGVLEYDIEHPVTTRLVTAYQETYQEAVDKLAANSTEPQQLVAPPPKPFR